MKLNFFSASWTDDRTRPQRRQLCRKQLGTDLIFTPQLRTIAAVRCADATDKAGAQERVP
jgi:hypothetical protein